MFSSKSFIVSGLTFRSLIHCEFVYGVRKCSNLILLRVAIQFSQHHLLKRLGFVVVVVVVPLCILAFFVKDKVATGAWVYLWVFCLVLLVYISVSEPVPYSLKDCRFVVLSEIRKIDSSNSIFPSQDCFGSLEYFLFPHKL